jgi:hypothetical protein
MNTASRPLEQERIWLFSASQFHVGDIAEAHLALARPGARPGGGIPPESACR